MDSTTLDPCRPRRLTRVARLLRKHDTWAEKLIENSRRDRRCSSHKFRCQHPFGPSVLGSCKPPSPSPWPSPKGEGTPHPAPRQVQALWIAESAAKDGRSAAVSEGPAAAGPRTRSSRINPT